MSVRLKAAIENYILEFHQGNPIRHANNNFDQVHRIGEHKQEGDLYNIIDMAGNVGNLERIITIQDQKIYAPILFYAVLILFIIVMIIHYKLNKRSTIV